MSDSTSNTLNVVKPQSPSPYVPVDAYQPQLSNSPFNPVPSLSMVGKPAFTTQEQSPPIPRGFVGRFQDLVGVPQTQAELTADELCASDGSAYTETSWSMPEGNHSRHAQSNRVMVDVHSTTMAANAAPASPLRRGGERATPVAGVLCGGRRSRVERAASTATSHPGAGSVSTGLWG